MTREQPPVARTLFAHKAESDKEFSVCCAAQEQRPAARSNQKTLQRCKLIIQLMLWAARAASDCGGVSDRRRASRAESDRKVAWPCEQLGQKPKPRSVPQKICHPPSVPRPVETRALSVALAIKFLHLRCLSLLLRAAPASGWVGVGALIDRSRKQTPCRIARRYDNNKANTNCGRVIAIHLVLGASNRRVSSKQAYALRCSRLWISLISLIRRSLLPISLHFSRPTIAV
jgi:hypothetical protein